MRIRSAVLSATILILISACSGPIVIPSGAAVTLPAGQQIILHATSPITNESAIETPAAVDITPEENQPTATITPTMISTPTPAPTRKSPYPVGPGSAIIDIGFQPISINNADLLKPVFSALNGNYRHSSISADGLKIFVSTSNGTYLLNRQGEILAGWQNIFTADIGCTSCISANRDGSRLAVITRNAGAWEAQVYGIEGNQANLILALPLEPVFKGAINEAAIAISPDNHYLAFKTGAGLLRVLDLQTNLQVFDLDRPINGIEFTRDGAYFAAQAGQEMLFYPVDDWKSRKNLLLPRENTPYAFSPNGKLFAIAMPAMLRIFELDKLRVYKEINIPPSNASTREWQIAFNDDSSISGYAIRWDSYRTSATIESGQWNIESGEALRFETTTSDSPDSLGALWGSPLILPVTGSELETGVLPYYALRFISDGILLVNSPHSACWLKLFTAETNCFKDDANNVFASDANTFKELRKEAATQLVELRGLAKVVEVGPYRIAAINRSGEWILVDNGTGTDLYTRGKTYLQESVKGSLQGFAENANRIVFTALENENTYTITVVDKTNGNAIIQKTDNFLYKPVIMTADGTIYYTQNELGRNQTVFNRIDPNTLQISELTRISLPAEPRSMILSNSGLFAVGMKDGSVMIMTQDFNESATIQAATSSVENISFSPDGRFLAVASKEGIRIFAIFPDAK